MASNTFRGRGSARGRQLNNGRGERNNKEDAFSSWLKTDHHGHSQSRQNRREMGAAGGRGRSCSNQSRVDGAIKSNSQAREETNGGKLKSPKQLSYGRLREWASISDSGDLVLFMSNETSQIQEFLSRDEVKEDFFKLFVTALAKATSSQLQKVAASRVLHTVCETPFFEKHLAVFVLNMSYSENGQERQSFLESLICIFESMLKLCPTQSIKCITALPQLRLIPGFDEDESNNVKLTDLEKRAKLCFKSSTNKYSDEAPPDNFLESSVLPSKDDLKENKVYLRPAKLEGRYDDATHYLDVQFRLMKQDFVTPLRNGILDFQKSGYKKHFKSQDTRFYFDVHILGFVSSGHIDHVLQFDVSKLKNIKWDFSKRLIYGSLVCLSKDGFETISIATVSDRNAEDLKKGFVNVTFKTGLDIVFKSSSNDEFVMAETVALFETYCHVLEGLQEMVDNLPLQQHIVSCEHQVHPPKYLLAGLSFPEYDLSPLMNKHGPKVVTVLPTTDWPAAKEMVLNESQREAAEMALTKRLAVIQGPPGTGKTYVGLKVVQTLLQNQVKMTPSCQKSNDGDPILVVCYTNHALDQFLEGILRFCSKGIIRVGGRSNSEMLKSFNLKEILKKNLADRSVVRARHACKDKLRTLMCEIKDASARIESISFKICGQSLLEPFMKADHVTSLKNSKEKGYHYIGRALSHWLNAKTDNIPETVSKSIEHVLTYNILHADIEPHPHKQTNVQTMYIRDRASLYLYYVNFFRSKLRKQLKKLEPMNFHQDVQKNIARIGKKLEESTKTILLDFDLKGVLPRMLFDKIDTTVKNVNHNKKDTRKTPSENAIQPFTVIKTWLLGSLRGHHSQLNDIEELQPKVMESNSEPENFPQMDFEDISPADIDQVEKDVDYEKETTMLRNSLASVFQRMRTLNIEVMEDEDVITEGEWQKVKKPLNFSQFERKLKRTKAMSEALESNINDVWTLNMSERFSLYKLWAERYKMQAISDMEGLVHQYTSVLSEQMAIRGQETVSVLRTAKVIGMTTTGAAKNRAVLQEVGCRIIVVEEAAEVLEAHIVTSLNKQCEHLILIGDHQQLRPSPVVYELAKNFGLEVSLFERLVKNKFPHVVLKEQHRMRPEISKIMRHIYPDLQDHPKMSEYEHVKGVSKDIYFIAHEELETAVADSQSKSNNFEAQYAIKLLEYLLLQGYEPTDVTILATYAGQVMCIKNKLRTAKINRASEVRVTSVDNFQGEENDIIILSLVRSNERNIVGFLKVDNRVCVALSRAKKGLYVIGNFKQLAMQSTLWAKIVGTTKAENILGDGLPVSCQNHLDQDPAIMFSGEDFDSRPHGGCGAPCGQRLECGHICGLTCHGYDLQHENYKCRKACSKVCSFGHPCGKMCFQDCGDNTCSFKVKKTIPACGHEDLVSCNLPITEAVCSHQCEIIFDCGHQCQGICGKCKKNQLHYSCKVVIQHQWPCGHQFGVECHEKEKPCPHPCGETLDCGHVCLGTCSGCLQGSVHEACGEKCDKKLPCGHLCSLLCSAPCSPCEQPCPNKCRHGSCQSSDQRMGPYCSHLCIPCKEKCGRHCNNCRVCDKLCSELCNKPACQKACDKSLSCGNHLHKCSGICGELCVCIICKQVEPLSQKLRSMGAVCEPFEESVSSEDTFYENDADKNNHKSSKASAGSQSLVGENLNDLVIKIPTCNHIFYVNELDRFVETFEPGGSSYIPCPKCGTPIQRCTRYESINLERSKRRHKLKKDLLKNSVVSKEQRRKLNESRALLQDSEFLQELSDVYIDNVKSKNEMDSLSFQIKFAYVLHEITSFKNIASDASAFDEKLSTRRVALLKVKCHVTAQQRQEFTCDFACFLWQAILSRLEDVCGKTFVEISDTLRGWKSSKRPQSDDTCLNDFLQNAETQVKCILSDVSRSSSELNLLTQIMQTTMDRVLKILRSGNDEQLVDIIGTSSATVASKSKSAAAKHRLKSSDLNKTKTKRGDELEDTGRFSLDVLKKSKAQATGESVVNAKNSLKTKESSTSKLMERLVKEKQVASIRRPSVKSRDLHSIEKADDGALGFFRERRPQATGRFKNTNTEDLDRGRMEDGEALGFSRERRLQAAGRSKSINTEDLDRGRMEDGEALGFSRERRLQASGRFKSINTEDLNSGSMGDDATLDFSKEKKLEAAGGFETIDIEGLSKEKELTKGTQKSPSLHAEGVMQRLWKEHCLRKAIEVERVDEEDEEIGLSDPEFQDEASLY